MSNRLWIILTGLVIGLAAMLLAMAGNPPNMGLCIACFLRDISGGLGLHQVPLLQYVRPEILGIVLGATLIALTNKELQVKGGSNPIIRFVAGIIMMLGMLVFLGCPLRIALRLGAGDLNALVGFIGLVVGVGVGSIFIKSGFSLDKATAKPKILGAVFPVSAVLLLCLLATSSTWLYFSQDGPGSMHAPIYLALVAGVLVGIFSQKSRFCMAGGIRDLLLFKDYNLIIGFIVIFLVALSGSLSQGTFKFGFLDQPIAHSETLWNFLGMAVAGWAAALLGGCPLRQLILSAQGNLDSVATVVGLVTGAALAHNYQLAASTKGVPVNGTYAVIVCLVLLVGISSYYTLRTIRLERSALNENC